VLLFSDIISDLALRNGLDIKKSEVHGFSQRGGVVDSHVRWGRRVGASTAEPGQIDVLLAFENTQDAAIDSTVSPLRKSRSKPPKNGDPPVKATL